MYYCTTCGVCSTVCEGCINTVDLWKAIRSNLVACGAGGSVKAGIHDLALDVAKARVVDVKSTKSQVVASTCPLCRRNLMDVITCSAPETAKDAVKKAAVVAAK